MSNGKRRPVAVVDGDGHLTIHPHQRPQDGQLTLRVHVDAAESVAFLLSALRASSELRVILMLPITRDEVEVIVDLNTSERAVSFLIQLGLLFSIAEKGATTVEGLRRYIPELNFQGIGIGICDISDQLKLFGN